MNKRIKFSRTFTHVRKGYIKPKLFNMTSSKFTKSEQMNTEIEQNFVTFPAQGH